MSVKSAILVAVAIFVLTLVARMPASVLSWLLPSGVHCQSPSGTLWHGACAELNRGNLALTDIQWTLHPLAMLHARLLLDASSDDPRATGHAQLSVHPNGDLDIGDLGARLSLQGGLTPLPAGWSGELDLAIAAASIQGGHLAAVQGLITANQLHMDRPATDLGSFELSFPEAKPSAPMIGALRDLSGPLSLQARLQLSPGGSYEISGAVAPRAASNPDLQQLLQLLGPPDDQGRHAFSLAGTL